MYSIFNRFEATPKNRHSVFRMDWHEKNIQQIILQFSSTFNFYRNRCRMRMACDLRHLIYDKQSNKISSYLNPVGMLRVMYLYQFEFADTAQPDLTSIGLHLIICHLAIA